MANETAISGYNGRVLIGSTSATLMQMASWEYSGPTREMIDKGTAFNETYKKVYPAAIDGGTVTVNGFYVPSNATNRGVVASLTSGADVSHLKLYFSSTGYYSNATANIYVESVNGPTVDSNGVAEITYNFRVSNGQLTKKGT